MTDEKRTYQRMSLAQKQALHRDRMREPAVQCPRCEVSTTVDDLLRHADACPGRRAAHPLAKWITWSEAVALGLPKMTLSDWARSGRVQSRGQTGEREYLLRDVTKLIARRRVRKSVPTEGGE